MALKPNLSHVGVKNASTTYCLFLNQTSCIMAYCTNNLQGQIDHYNRQIPERYLSYKDKIDGNRQ